MKLFITKKTQEEENEVSFLEQIVKKFRADISHSPTPSCPPMR
jgi:hypothetical protein